MVSSLLVVFLLVCNLLPRVVVMVFFLVVVVVATVSSCCISVPALWFLLVICCFSEMITAHKGYEMKSWLVELASCNLSKCSFCSGYCSCGFCVLPSLLSL